MSLSFYRRRAALSVIAVAALLPATLGLAQTAAPEALRFKAIKVDYAPLRDNGSGVYAGWLAEALPAALDQAFALRPAIARRRRWWCASTR